MAGEFREELAEWETDGFEDRLRTKLLEAKISGPCVLDVREEIILSFPQGDWSLVERDLRVAFSAPLAERVAASIREEVETCLAVRRELINYKKLCLHLWKAGSTIEKDLRQLASFFYCDLRYTDIANTMNECRGAVAAVWDARYFGKTICNLPRHPDSGVPWKFEELPQSLEVWKALEQAEQFLAQHPELDAYLASRWRHFSETNEADVASSAPSSSSGAGPLQQRRRDLLCPVEGVDGAEKETPSAASRSAPGAMQTRDPDVEHDKEAFEQAEDGAGVQEPSKPAKKSLAWKSERVLVPSPLSTEGLQGLLRAVRSCGVELPPPALGYIEQSLVSRGAAKATTLTRALARYIAALREALERARRLQSELSALLEKPPSETSLSAGLHLFCEKHLRIMQGIVHVVPEMLQWLDPIAAMRGDSERLFVSGAQGAAAFVPRGFADLLRPYRDSTRGHRAAMLDELAKGKWPRSARPPPLADGSDTSRQPHLHPCRRCGERFTRLWLHRELCFVCEAALREEGRCPFSERCGTRSFCPHERLCIVCEQWSCEECRLLRGDGEDVWQVVGHWRPDVVFLDFDRTLATTKAGASPLQGNHTVDPDLAAVCGGHPNVQIVTRSSRREDILAFLAAKGSSVRRVHSLKLDGRRSKAEVILEEMGALPTPDARGLFVDDDIKELTDPGVAQLVQDGRLQRVLFVRAGGKE